MKDAEQRLKWQSRNRHRLKYKYVGAHVLCVGVYRSCLLYAGRKRSMKGQKICLIYECVNCNHEAGLQVERFSVVSVVIASKHYHLD